MSKDSGIVNIHGKEYSTVAKRVQDFRGEFPIEKGWSIVTEVLERTAEDVLVKASIIFDGTVLATGHGEEKRSASMINKTSALENAETSAIGRALAAAGRAGTEFASADEVAQAISQQGAPKPRSGTPMTDKQAGLLKALLKDLGADDKTIVMKLGGLNTAKEASDAIEKVQAKLRDKKAGKDVTPEEIDEDAVKAFFANT